MRGSAGTLVILAILCARPIPVSAARPKIAALILKSGTVDEELADNLTEVLIARLARRGDHEIAGKEELKSKLGVDEKAAAACMENLGCLGRVGTELGVTRMVVGTLGRRDKDYLYNLSLIDIATGRVEARTFELIAGGRVEQLIAAVQTASDKLFAPKIEPGAIRVASETLGALVYLDEAFIGSSPVRREGIEPGVHRMRVEKEGHVAWAREIEVPAGSTLEIKVPLAALPKRRRWPTQLATATVVVAALPAVVGIVLVTLASDAPSSSTITRREAVDSADRRFLEGQIGVGLFVAAGAFALTSAIVTLVCRRDIFETRPGRGPRLSLGPSSGGLRGALEVRW